MEKENHSTNKSIELLEENKGFCWLKNNYLFIVLFSIIIWIILSLISNDYEIKNIVIKTINDTQNTIDTKTFFSLNQKYLLLSLVSNLFLTFGITLFISMFFSNYFERKERKDFENKLLEFQEQTAKNAYLSLFHQIVDESFFSIVKQDIIQCKKIRLDAKWIYDIQESINDNNIKILILRRTIKYTIKNLSNDKQNEEISFSSFSNSFLATDLESIQVENNNGNYDERKHELENNRIIIKLEPNSSKKIIKIIQQTFSSNFIYETQFASCPLADLEIEINYPLGYKFELSVESFSIKPTKEIDIDGKQVYHFNAAILRGQGVEFYCEKIEC